MTYAEQLHFEAKERRQRIASKAVPDEGIDLKRKKLTKPYGCGISTPHLPASLDPTPEQPPVKIVYDVLEEIPISQKIVKISVNRIIQIISDIYHVDMFEVISHRRQVHIVIPRHIAMYFAKKLTPLSFPSVGRRFNDRDHTTIIAAFYKIERKAKTNALFAVELQRIESIILEAHNGA